MLEWSFHGNLCWTIGPLLSQRFPLASAKAQPGGGGFSGYVMNIIKVVETNFDAVLDHVLDSSEPWLCGLGVWSQVPHIEVMTRQGIAQYSGGTV